MDGIKYDYIGKWMEGSEKKEELCSFHCVADIVLIPLSKFISLKPTRGWYYCLYFTCVETGSERLDNLLKSTQLSKTISVRE